MTELRETLEQLKQRAYSLKTKKAQAKAWAKVREVEREILMDLSRQRDTFATHSVKATVCWFHEGDEVVRLETPYGTVYGSPTSDIVSKSWYGHTCCVNYVKGQQVIVEIEVDIAQSGLHLELIPKRIYGGTLNESKYAELDKRTDLAFFKHSNSEGVTGLFSQTKGGSRG